MGWVLPVVVAAVGVWIAFSIVVWATGQDTLRDDAPSGVPAGLGRDGPIGEDEVGTIRFDTVLRGYRADQVDTTLDRLAWEIGRRDERLAVLERQLAAVSAEPAEPEAEPDGESGSETASGPAE